MTCRSASRFMIYRWFCNKISLYDFRIIIKKTSGHSCKFVQSHMNTIYCLNNVFQYYVELTLATFCPTHTHFISSPYGGLPNLFKHFTKKDNSNAIRARLLKGLHYYNAHKHHKSTTFDVELGHIIMEISVALSMLESGTCGNTIIYMSKYDLLKPDWSIMPI